MRIFCNHLGAGLGAVHDSVAPVERKGILKFSQTFLSKFITGVNHPPICLQNNNNCCFHYSFSFIFILNPCTYSTQTEKSEVTGNLRIETCTLLWPEEDFRMNKLWLWLLWQHPLIKCSIIPPACMITNSVQQGPCTIYIYLLYHSYIWRNEKPNK